MIGVVAYPPKVPAAVIGAVQATPSCLTLPAEIELVATRVFGRSPFGAGHWSAWSEISGAPSDGSLAPLAPVLPPPPPQPITPATMTTAITPRATSTIRLTPEVCLPRAGLNAVKRRCRGGR